MVKIKQNRNGMIDYQKLFYSFIIVILHYYIDTRRHFAGGGHAVEFFLIVSGVFFFKSFHKKCNNMNSEQKLNYPMEFIKDRFIKFLPYTTIAFCFSFIIVRILPLILDNVLTFNLVIDSFVKDIWELFLIAMNGMNRNNNLINDAIWTLSAMLIVEFVVLCILVRNEKLYFKVIVPISILIGFGFWGNAKSTDNELWHGFFTFGVLRTFIATSLSYYAWKLSDKLKSIPFNRLGEALMTISEVGLHLLLISIMAYNSNRYYRWLCAFLFVFAIAITLSGKSATARVFKQSKLSDFLGKWSMAIYMIHMPLLKLWKLKFTVPDVLYNHKFTYAIVLVIVSLLFMAMGDFVYKQSKNVFAWIKKKTIADYSTLENDDISISI